MVLKLASLGGVFSLSLPYKYLSVKPRLNTKDRVNNVTKLYVYSTKHSRLLTMNVRYSLVRIHTLFIVKHLSYICNVLWRVHIFFFNFRRQVDITTFNNEHLILIWFFLFIDIEFDFKITLRILNPENHQEY